MLIKYRLCIYSKLEFKFKKRSIGITPSKDIHLPVGKTIAIDCEMVRKPSDLSVGSVVVKMKSQREDSLPQTLRVAVVNGKMHMNVTNTGQRDLHLHRCQIIGIADLRSAGYYHITRVAYKDVCLRDSYSSMKRIHKIIFHSYIQLMTLMIKYYKSIQDLI